MSKNVLITGSTSGIGLGIAKSFAKAGYNIVFNGLETNGADIAAEIAKEYGVKTFFHGANLLFPDQIEDLFLQATTTIGNIDILVNNAGIQYVAPIDEFPVEKWNQIIGINLTSAFHTSRLVWKGMKAAGWGRIINIASAHGLVASEFKSAYVSAKHGLLGLTKTLALEGATCGIRVNAICPGYVKTPLVEKQIADQAKTHNIPESEVISTILLAKQPIKDFVTVEDLGAMSVFLCSENSNLFTGSIISMDGGWSAQ